MAKIILGERVGRNGRLGMGIEIVEPDWQITRLAASYKIRGNISYADCFTAALAKPRKGEV